MITLVQEFVNDKGINTVIYEGWWERFKQRHPNISLHVAASSYTRAMVFDKESLDYYFDLLEDTLKANQISSLIQF